MGFNVFRVFTFSLLFCGISLGLFQYMLDNIENDKVTTLQKHGSPSKFYSSKNILNLPYGYKPPCLIKSLKHKSAIQRARSDHCKKELAELACRTVDAPDGIGDLYPTHLPNLWQLTKSIDPELSGKYLGKHIKKSKPHFHLEVVFKTILLCQINSI